MWLSWLCQNLSPGAIWLITCWTFPSTNTCRWFRRLANLPAARQKPVPNSNRVVGSRCLWSFGRSQCRALSAATVVDAELDALVDKWSSLLGRSVFSDTNAPYHHKIQLVHSYIVYMRAAGVPARIGRKCIVTPPLIEALCDHLSESLVCGSMRWLSSSGMNSTPESQPPASEEPCRQRLV